MVNRMSLVLDEGLIEDDDAYAKYLVLKSILKDRSVIVSFSGGVDSTFLALVAKSVCERALAVTADSPTLAPGELGQAKDLARLIAIPHIVINHNELEDPDFARNPSDRCYYCKRGLLSNLEGIAARQGYDMIVEGTNAEDLEGHRPGRRAVIELGVSSPLVEAGLTKKEIRSLSRRLGLPTWNKPSMACLASRIPHDSPITYERLQRIGQAEALLRGLGFGTVRVRDHGEIASIEVDCERIPQLVESETRRTVVGGLNSLGFRFVAVDLSGYRTGSLSQVTIGKDSSDSKLRDLAPRSRADN